MSKKVLRKRLESLIADLEQESAKMAQPGEVFPEEQSLFVPQEPIPSEPAQFVPPEPIPSEPFPLVPLKGKPAEPRAESHEAVESRVAIEQTPPSLFRQDTLQEFRPVFQSAAPDRPATITLPFRSEGPSMGVLEITDDVSDRTWNEDELRLVEQVADQLSLALENARLFQQTQTALSETELLYQASAELNLAQNYEDILAILRKHTIAGRGSNSVSLSLFNRPWSQENLPDWVDVLARWTSLPAETLAIRYTLQSFPSLTELLRSDAPLILEDVAADSRLDENTRQLYAKTLSGASTVFVPYVVSNQWLGFINVVYPQPTTFPDADVRRLLALSAQAAVAVENLRSIELAEQRAQEAHKRSEELALVNRVVSSVVSSPDLNQSLNTVATELLNAFNLESVAIALLTEDRQSLTMVADQSISHQVPSIGFNLPVKGDLIAEQVIQTHRPVVVANAQNDPRMASRQNRLRREQTQSIAVLPLIVGGEVIGTIDLDVTEKGRVMTDEELTLAETLVVQISTSIQNARLFQQTQEALSESETLYLASGEINAAQNSESILNILRKSTIMGHSNASHAEICLFDHPWDDKNIPDWLIPIARWSNQSSKELLARYPIHGWTSVRSILQPDNPTIVEDTTSDVRLDDTARATYVEQMKAKGLAFFPLVIGRQWIGHIIVAYTERTPFTSKDIRPLTALAAQAAVAIQNLRLLDETRRRATQLATAAEIARDTSGTLALDTLLDRSVNLIRDRYGYYHSSIFLVDETGESATVRASTGRAGEEMRRRGHKLTVGSQSIIGYVTQSGEALVVNDVAQSPIHRLNPLLPETRAELAIPLKIGQRTIGALDVQATQLDAFTPDDVAVLQTLADQTAVAVDNARSYELAQQAIKETRQRVQELSVIYDVSQSLASAPMESGEIGNLVARYFIDVLDFPECSISLYDPETDQLHILTDLTRTPDSKEIVPKMEETEVFLLSDYPATAQVMSDLQPLIVQAKDPNAQPAELSYMWAHEIYTMVILPLAVKGQAFGIIELEAWDKERHLTTEQTSLATTLANAAAVALENARLYEEQLGTTEKLREVDKMKSQFLANMSHELRTPLNSIIGFSRVILKGIDGPVTDLQQQDLGAIHTAGQHLLNLINDILDISKIEAGKMELALQDDVDLHSIINGAMSYAVGLTKEKPVKLERDIPKDLPKVRADATRIRQVLINFLSNAAKFTEEGTITVKASVQSSPEGKPEILISVTDTGIGISPEDQKKLFLAFSQVDASATRKTGGSGLGLSISRLLIEIHGGRVGVISDVGKGSTFYFTLPIPYVEGEAETTEPKRLILAIDDDRQVISLYERYLKSHGYQVIALTEAKQAVERAREVQPFAITLDIMMPGQSGWQVLEELKADEYTRNIPVIVCSIVAEQEKGFSLGAADYLTKPILQDDLVTSLNRLNRDGNIHQVLVIDDDPDDLRLVQKILEENGQFTVRLANGGPEGLAAIRTQAPDAIILDLFMPGMDGFSLLETVRSDPKLCDIPAIIFTAGDLTDEQTLRLSQFTQQVVQKGLFKEQELLGAIKRTLDQFAPPDKERGKS